MLRPHPTAATIRTTSAMGRHTHAGAAVAVMLGLCATSLGAQTTPAYDATIIGTDSDAPDSINNVPQIGFHDVGSWGVWIWNGPDLGDRGWYCYVNDLGHAVWDDYYANTARFWNGSENIDVPLLAGAINNNDVVAGRLNHSPDAAIWSPAGGLQVIGTLGGICGWYYAINDANTVVGTSETVHGDDHAFIWSADTGIADLNDRLPPDSPWTLITARGINSAGEIVGVGVRDGEHRGYLLRDETVIDLGSCDLYAPLRHQRVWLCSLPYGL